MSTLSRFPTSTGANKFFKRDNTFRILTGDYQTPAYASSLAIVANATETLIQQTLTGAVTYTVNVGAAAADDNYPFVGDVILFMLQSDSTSRTATFGTGFAVNGTFAVTTAKFATIQFIYNGSVWVEVSRTVTA